MKMPYQKFLCLFFSAGLLTVCRADPSFAAVKSLDEDDDDLDAQLARLLDEERGKDEDA